MTEHFPQNGSTNQQVSDSELTAISVSEIEPSPLIIESEIKPFEDVNSSHNTPVDVEDTSSSPLMQWFSNLPVNRKQVTTLVTSEIISVIGIAGIGVFLIWTTGHNQLTNQSKSEVAVTELNYMTKINQMGFGFRGQSDNVAIINIARLYKNKEVIPVGLRQQVKQILLGETIARKIEYATLVGTDGKIIANANASRIGVSFDPGGLVSKVLDTGYQYKSSAIVSQEELKKENPLLPDGFEGKEALIRYTATPVKNPANKSIIGVLISGDIVNHKLPIPQATLKSFDGGYSAIYFRKSDGSFEQATSLQQTADEQLPNVSFPSLSLLQSALDNQS